MRDVFTSVNGERGLAAMSSDRVNDRLDSIFGSMDGGSVPPGTGPAPVGRPPSDFATTHQDLRKAVNQAQGIVGLLAHAGLNDHQANLLTQIQQAIRELAHLINHQLRAPAPAPLVGGSSLTPKPQAPAPRNAVPAAGPLAGLRKPFGAPGPTASPSPVAPSPPPQRPQHPSHRSRPPARTDGRRGTILVGDGVPSNHRLFSNLLGRVDCGVDLAENGQVVVDKLSQSTYDAVILNCHLPLVNGLDVVATIRRQGFTASGSQPLPAILYADPELRGFRERVETLGVPFFAKPYDLVSLEKLLQRFLPRCDEVQPPPGTPAAAAIRPDLVDTSTLNALCQRLSPQEFVSIYQRYLERSPKLIVEILQSMSAQAVDRMEQAAAVLLNSSAELGAVELAEKCRAITALCRAGRVASTAGLVVGLDGTYRRTCEALQTAVEAAFQV